MSPEENYIELDVTDDAFWPLTLYGKCLEDWDVMNRSMSMARKGFNKHRDDKWEQRLGGLELLRDVDTGE